MQVYVAGAAKLTGRQAIVYTAKRKVRSAATQYAMDMNAEVNEIPCGYLSVLRARTAARIKELGQCVQWIRALALEDAAAQTANIPLECKRILVATGSGLTAAGILVGLARMGRIVPVIVVSVSPMASVDAIQATAVKGFGAMHGSFLNVELIRHPFAYSKPVEAYLPDATRLDPFYAAKGLTFVQPGDLFWVPGRRPEMAMPEARPPRRLRKAKVSVPSIDVDKIQPEAPM
jgi:1-aminocyclopropane-1-carboxylate deaminase/D-cysteine desulfhydrase-like pyridoxal-dependent ACC family enzyme